MHCFISAFRCFGVMNHLSRVGAPGPLTAKDEQARSGRPRFAPPSRRPIEGFGNALTTAVEIVVVTIVGYVIGQRVWGAFGGGVGLVLGAVASFVRLYYRAGFYESPLARLKHEGEGRDASVPGNRRDEFPRDSNT